MIPIQRPLQIYVANTNVGAKKVVAGTPGNAGGVGQPKRPKDIVITENEERALRQRGMNLDDQARKLGYSDWTTYMGETEKYARE